jgi:alkylated DNA nucleotide flippase Atl1
MKICRGLSPLHQGLKRRTVTEHCVRKLPAQAAVAPYHRIIGANGTLTGYAGGIERKGWLLRHEGALAPDFLANSEDLVLSD